jgi:hypothetical protein
MDKKSQIIDFVAARDAVNIEKEIEKEVEDIISGKCDDDPHLGVLKDVFKQMKRGEYRPPDAWFFEDVGPDGKTEAQRSDERFDEFMDGDGKDMLIDAFDVRTDDNEKENEL